MNYFSNSLSNFLYSFILFLFLFDFYSTTTRTRRNAHLTEDKEIEEKLAIGEFVRKGEQRIRLERIRKAPVY